MEKCEDVLGKVWMPTKTTQLVCSEDFPVGIISRCPYPGSATGDIGKRYRFELNSTGKDVPSNRFVCGARRLTKPFRPPVSSVQAWLTSGIMWNSCCRVWVGQACTHDCTAALLLLDKQGSFSLPAGCGERSCLVDWAERRKDRHIVLWYRSC